MARQWTFNQKNNYFLWICQGVHPASSTFGGVSKSTNSNATGRGRAVFGVWLTIPTSLPFPHASTENTGRLFGLSGVGPPLFGILHTFGASPVFVVKDPSILLFIQSYPHFRLNPGSFLVDIPSFPDVPPDHSEWSLSNRFRRQRMHQGKKTDQKSFFRLVSALEVSTVHLEKKN